MTWFKGTWHGIPIALLAVLAVALVASCSLITSVDRDDVGAGGAGGGPYGAANALPSATEYEYEKIDLPDVSAGPVSLGIDFIWDADEVAHPAPVELSVELAGVTSPMLQVFSVEGTPFVRAASQVEQLQAGTAYRVELTREGLAAWVKLVRSDDDEPVLDGPVAPVDEQSSGVVTVVRPKHKPHVQLLDLATWRGYGS